MFIFVSNLPTPFQPQFQKKNFNLGNCRLSQKISISTIKIRKKKIFCKLGIPIMASQKTFLESKLEKNQVERFDCFSIK